MSTTPVRVRAVRSMFFWMPDGTSSPRYDVVLEGVHGTVIGVRRLSATAGAPPGLRVEWDVVLTSTGGVDAPTQIGRKEMLMSFADVQYVKESENFVNVAQTHSDTGKSCTSCGSTYVSVSRQGTFYCQNCGHTWTHTWTPTTLL